MVLANGAHTVDFGTVGANGIDTGVQALSTWYYIHEIAKPDGTKAALGSLSATAPTLPAGYTFFNLISAVRSDASVHFIKYRQVGNTVFYETGIGVFSTTGAGNLAETSASLTIVIPPIAQMVKSALSVYANQTTGVAVTMNIHFRVISGSDFALFTGAIAASSYGSLGGGFDFPNISQTFYVQAEPGNAATFTDKAINISVGGFTLPMGGQ
jgi:hypothetical protein